MRQDKTAILEKNAPLKSQSIRFQENGRYQLFGK